MQSFIKGLVLFNAVGVLGQMGPSEPEIIPEIIADTQPESQPEIIAETTPEEEEKIIDATPEEEEKIIDDTSELSEHEDDTSDEEEEIIDATPEEEEKLIDTSKASELSCVVYKNWAVYDLRELMKVENYEADNDVSFNFCKFAIAPENPDSNDKTFAYLTDESPKI